MMDIGRETKNMAMVLKLVLININTKVNSLTITKKGKES